MNRSFRVFNIPDQDSFKNKALQWSQQFGEVAWLDSNTSPQLYSTFDAVLAVDASASVKSHANTTFDILNDFRENCKDWIFGYISYDVKNAIEKLSSSNTDELHFPDSFFFQPKKIFFIKNRQLTCAYLAAFEHEIERDLEEILHFKNTTVNTRHRALPVKPRMQKNDYLERVKKILSHIRRGNVYEVNFCQEFYSENAIINPPAVYKKLNAISQTPFSAYLTFGDHYLLSASPERYLKKEGGKIISQPIKGTAKRSADKEEDRALKSHLQNSPKERAENIMIVDLVRNDLSKIAQKGSVSVEELCKVYSFRQLHQMISTISCTVSNKTDPLAVIKATFPMGSMTGAPKIAAMKIIETLELSKRGLYSGAMGYFSPEGDFDLNVVIRSILYNAGKKYVSFSVGSAITAKSSPEAEYEECLAKAKAMEQVLTGKV